MGKLLITLDIEGLPYRNLSCTCCIDEIELVFSKQFDKNLSKFNKVEVYCSLFDFHAFFGDEFKSKYQIQNLKLIFVAMSKERQRNIFPDRLKTAKK